MKFFRGVAFYILLIAVGIAVVLFPIDDQVAVVILIHFLTKDLQKVKKWTGPTLRSFIDIEFYSFA